MTTQAKLAIVSPEDFRRRTALFFSSRSGTTLKVDAAYDAYYTVRSEQNRSLLHNALDEYLRAHGNSWDRCERDKVSGGLLGWLWSFTKPDLPETSDQRSQNRLNDYDIPHSRFGVLFLLGNIGIELDKMSLVIEGIGAVGGVVGSALSLDTDKLHTSNSSKVAFTVKGHHVTAQQITSGSALLTSIGGMAVAAAPVTRQANKQVLTQAQLRAQGVADWTRGRQVNNQAAIDEHVRQLSHRDWFPTSTMALQAASSKISETFELSKVAGAVMGAGTVIAGTAAAPVVVAYDLLAKLWNGLKNKFYQIKDKIVAKIMSDGTWPYHNLGIIAKSAAKIALDMVFKHAVPFVSGLVDVGTGLARTLDMAYERVSSFLNRRKIRIVPGHPEEIANSIEASMSQGMFLGMKDLLKGVGSTALQAYLPGLGSVVNAAVVAFEWLIKFIYRVAEIFRIDAFLKKARLIWMQEKRNATRQSNQGEEFTVVNPIKSRTEAAVLRSLAEGQPTRTVELTFGANGQLGRLAAPVKLQKPVEPAKGGTGHLEPDVKKGLIADREKFTAFFREGCSASPLIPMIVLNSGICGSLMTMMKMVEDVGTAIDQKEFNAGSRYFARLKEYSANYLRSSGFVFKPVRLDDNYIRGLLYHAVNHHQSPTSWGKAVRAVATA